MTQRGARKHEADARQEEAAFRMPRFGAGLRENLKELFRPGPRRSAGATMASSAGAGLASDAWRPDAHFARVEALSVTIHISILALLLIPLARVAAPQRAGAPGPYDIYSAADVAAFLKHLKQTSAAAAKLGGGGGGGERNPQPASAGMVPPFSWTQLVAPRVRLPQNPQFPAPPSVLGPDGMKLQSPKMDNWGESISRIVNGSSGQGGPNGIGNGHGDGLGDGDGNGVGHGHDWGIGGNYPTAGANGYADVVCLYCPQAQYSNEAVKAKYQGSVMLTVVVTPDGRATDVQVVKGLGMGLDERAKVAVSKWRFRAPVGPDGRPAAVRATVEVVFHLY